MKVEKRGKDKDREKKQKRQKEYMSLQMSQEGCSARCTYRMLPDTATVHILRSYLFMEVIMILPFSLLFFLFLPFLIISLLSSVLLFFLFHLSLFFILCLYLPPYINHKYTYRFYPSLLLNSYYLTLPSPSLSPPTSSSDFPLSPSISPILYLLLSFLILTITLTPTSSSLFISFPILILILESRSRSPEGEQWMDNEVCYVHYVYYVYLCIIELYIFYAHTHATVTLKHCLT